MGPLLRSPQDPERDRFHLQHNGFQLDPGEARRGGKRCLPGRNAEGFASSQDSPRASGGPDAGFGHWVQRTGVGGFHPPITFPWHMSRIPSAVVGTWRRVALFNHFNSLSIMQKWPFLYSSPAEHELTARRKCPMPSGTNKASAPEMRPGKQEAGRLSPHLLRSHQEQMSPCKHPISACSSCPSHSMV